MTIKLDRPIIGSLIASLARASRIGALTVVSCALLQAPATAQYAPSENFAPNYQYNQYNQPNYQPGYQQAASGFGGVAQGGSFNGGFSGLNAQPMQPAYPQPAYPPPAYQQQPSQQQPSQRQPAQQPGNLAALEQTLNAVDTNAAWSRTPVSGTRGQLPASARPASPMSQQRYAAPQMAPAATYARPQMVTTATYAHPQALPAATYARPQSPAPGGFFNMMQGMFPGVTRQDMMRCFFDGGSPQMSGSGAGSPQQSQNNADKTSTAYENYQIACNEESRARNDANTARYNSSKWNRKDAASRAEYAANNAEYAAERAESAAYSGGSQARHYADLARAAANRARENANLARYNADTIQ